MPYSISILFHFLKISPYFAEYLHQLRGKHAAFAVDNHTVCLVRRIGVLVASFVYQRIIHIRHGNKLGGNGNLLPFKTVRVSLSVIALMMVTADFITDFFIIRLPFLVNFIQKLTAADSMGLHILIFILGQPARL